MITIQGKGVSAGVGVGPLYFYRRATAEIKRYTVEDTDAEWHRFKGAQTGAVEQLGVLAEQARKEAGDAAAMLFETHQMMAEDLDYEEAIEDRITNQKMNDYLKELGELAEINEPVRETYYKGNERIDEVTPKYALLSTHAGRRTFICNALALGIPAQVVMKWTGHSDYKAMKPYIDIADDIKANAMNKFNQL